MKRVMWCLALSGLVLCLSVQSVAAGEDSLTLFFPPSPLPATRPDVNLTYLAINFGQVVTEVAPIYPSPETAVTGKVKMAVRTLPIGIRRLTYVSFLNEEVVDGIHLYAIGSGEWMTAMDVKRVHPSNFQGLVFRYTPETDFGWVLKETQAVSLPADNGLGTISGQPLAFHQIVRIYDVRSAGGKEWYLVAPGQWVEGDLVARVHVNTTPPEGVSNGRWVEVNLAEQTLSVYDASRLVFATLVSSGSEPFWTRPGLFQIREKVDAQTMRLYDPTFVDNYLLEDVPWTMYFDQARALHGAYWHNHFGMAGSRGCVNMSVGDAHWLYNWAKVGEWIYVWDPTGQTPTDPAAYGEGGA